MLHIWAVFRDSRANTIRTPVYTTTKDSNVLNAWLWVSNSTMKPGPPPRVDQDLAAIHNRRFEYVPLGWTDIGVRNECREPENRKIRVWDLSGDEPAYFCIQNKKPLPPDLKSAQREAGDIGPLT